MRARVRKCARQGVCVFLSEREKEREGGREGMRELGLSCPGCEREGARKRVWES